MWRWAVLATLAAAVVCACLATRARTDKSGAASRAPHSIWTALSRARGAGGTARSRAPVWTACALLTALGGLRARDEASAPFDREGRFEPRREFDGTVRGPLTPGSLEVEIQSGLVEPGERVAIRGGRAAVERARGPVAAPPPRYAAPRVTVLPDEVVRLGPPGEDVRPLPTPPHMTRPPFPSAAPGSKFLSENVIAEHRPRVGVGLLDGLAGNSRLRCAGFQRLPFLGFKMRADLPLDVRR